MSDSAKRASTQTVIAASADAIVRALESYGIDGRALAREMGVPERAFADRGARVAMDVVDRFLGAAAERSGDEAFGLRLAEQHSTIEYHLFFSLMASDTVADSLHRFVRFQRMLADEMPAAFDPKAACIEFNFSEAGVGHWVVADAFAAGVSLAAKLMTMDAQAGPKAIELRRPAPRDTDRYVEFFGCPVTFAAEKNRMFVDPETLKRKLPSANPQIARRSDDATVEYLASLDGALLSTRVRRALVDTLPDGKPNRETVAAAVGMSTRNMARALAAEDTSYRDILDDVRETLAREYVRDGRTTLTEIAFILGFADTSTFSRAFRRWTGQAPSTMTAPAEPKL